MKKKWGAKVGWATAQIVLKNRVLYCDLEAAREVKVYCKRWLDCIVVGLEKLYCKNCIARGLAEEAGCVTIQTLYRDCSHLKGKFCIVIYSGVL